ncbi:MAG: hypothetical protein MZV64_58735 [Ignavibacteriales bacterium]|nr:hypothetical protein [Ignavibacteriales bacterium]
MIYASGCKYWESTRQISRSGSTVAGSVAMVAMTVVISACAAAYPRPKRLKSPPRWSTRSSPGRTCTPSTAWNVTATTARWRSSKAWKDWKARRSRPSTAATCCTPSPTPPMYEVIAYGRPERGHAPFGKTYGGELSASEIDYIDHLHALHRGMTASKRRRSSRSSRRWQMAKSRRMMSTSQPIVKRYCISCHRAGKDNNNYLMTTYEEILTTGDNVDNNIIAGDMNSYLLQTIQGTPIMDPANPTRN